MGSDLYTVSVIDRQPRTLTLDIQCIHPDVLYVADDPGFALMILHSAIPYQADTPLGAEVSLDDMMNPDWARRYARGFIRSVRAFDEQNPCPPEARDDPHHPYWEGSRAWLSWKLEVEVSHPQWIAHITDTSSWESRAFSPASHYDPHPEPIEPEPISVSDEVEGMFVWVPRECFADMSPDWGDFPALLEMPAYPENHYVFEPIEPAITTLDARWLGRPIFVKTSYSDLFGAVALTPDASANRAHASVASFATSYAGYGSLDHLESCHTVLPRVVKRRGEKLSYDRVLDGVYTTVTHIRCQGTLVTFTLRRPPHSGKALPIKSESDALNLLMGPDWSSYFRELREPHSALTRAVIADGVTLGIETEHRIKELVPLIARKYVRSFRVIPPEEEPSPSAHLDDLTHAEARERLLGPWPETTVRIKVTDPRWLEHLEAATLPFATYSYPLPAPSDPPVTEKASENPVEEDLCDERVILWRDDPTQVTWSAERHGALLKTRWGGRHLDRLREKEKTFDSEALAAKSLEKQVKKKIKDGYYPLLSPAEAAARMKELHGVTFAKLSPPTIEEVPDPAEKTKDYRRLRAHDVLTGVGVMGGKDHSRVLFVEELLAALELAKKQGKRREYVWFYRPASSTSTSVDFDLTTT